ncbi:hypothetical protein SO802_022534 [Lithocarpus litseifolius]|uniref:DUF4283 domain-containing protein n=1 Tax=Lithocarpus litseifolius TaxID=425828 RepID=A0AAW2C577_9ROSI
MKPRTLSREEEAELARSNKKVKDINHAGFNGGSRASSPSLGDQAMSPNTKPSFKDKLVGEIPGAFAQAFDLTDHMEEDSDSDEESGEASKSVREGQVKIKLSKETKKCIRVRFYSKEDLERVIKRGPWFIGDHFLSLRPWEPFFKPSTANISLIAVWIRLNELPIELYETEVLKEIGESIGKVLRIDSHTAMEARGRYARLCIQVDINKPLVNSILIGRFEQNLHSVDTHNACEETDMEGHYGPWMMVSRRRYVQKGKRTDYGTVLGTGSVGSSVWNSTNQLSPVFAEGTSMTAGGPSQSKSLPRRRANPKTGAGSKNEMKSWASKTPGVFNIKERPISSLSLVRLPVDSFKEAVVCLKQDSSPSPSSQIPITYPSSVKSKKHLARSLASDILPKSAVSSCVEGLDKKINPPPFTHPPLSRSEANQTSCATFEFSAKANVETGVFVEGESDRRLHVQLVGEKSLADDHMVSVEGVQRSPQSLESKDRRLVEDQLVSDDRSHAEVDMVSDEGSGAAPFL